MNNSFKLLVASMTFAYLLPMAAAQQQIYPGVWKYRLGTPERLTPLAFRSAPAAPGLRTKEGAKLPIGFGTVGFRKLGNGCSIELPLSEGEKIYGLGLNTKLFELSGRKAWVVPSDNPEAETNESHAPEPFYVSSAGYGVYVDTARYASYYVGDTDPVSGKGSVTVHVPGASGADVYVFAGPTALESVKRYNLFSGGGSVPPLWGLGIAYRGEGSFTSEQALKLARSFRDTHMPCDIFGVEPGWQTKTYSSSFVWNLEKFPDPDGFINSMHSLGYSLSFWEHPFTHPSSPIYGELTPYAGNYRVWGGLVPDFATQGGRRVYLEQQKKVLFSKGVDAVKIDEIDNQPFRPDPWSFPDASLFPSGLDGEQMHSLIGILAQQTLLKPLQDQNLRTWGLVRDSHALAAPLPYTVYSDSYNHADYIRGLVKMGFGGHLWVPEVRDATSVPDLIRRVQTVIFSPYAMVNCWYMASPPWRQIDKDLSQKGVEMPEAEETTNRVRKLFELRMSLVPYIYAAFQTYRKEGTPVVRALTLDYQGRRETAKIDDQFIFGPSIMVAPLMGSETTRKVYFPRGDWYDFFSGEKVSGGGWKNVTKSLDEIPLYVKGNTLLPLAKPVEHVVKDTVFDVQVKIYGPTPAPTSLFEDDGITLQYVKGAQTELHLSWNGTASTKRTGAYATQRYRITDWVKAF